MTANSASKAWNLAGLKCVQVILTNDHDGQTWEDIGFLTGHGHRGHAGTPVRTGASAPLRLRERGPCD